jgi:hypothetical protein
VWASLYTPIGTLKYEKLNYRITRFSTLMDELIGQKFSGYVEILAPHEHGLVILYNGKVCNCFYEGTEDLTLSREEVIEHFLRTETKERDTIINVGELAPRIIVALGALEIRQPAHRELETVFLDLGRLLETLSRKHFTGALRFYRIRNNTRLGNILLRLKKITADQLREAIRLQLSGEGALRLGDALVQSGAIGKKDLEDALDRQSNTRKGSDLELAIALFSEGEFLGGYRYADKKIVSDRAEVISWLSTSETLMDIIDGMLPPMIDIASLLQLGKPDKTSSSAAPIVEKNKPEFKLEQIKTPWGNDKSKTKTTEPPKPQPQPNAKPIKKEEPAKKKPAEPEVKERTAMEDTTIRELTKETFMLKADDLILDIHPHPIAPPMGDDEVAADADLQWLDNIVDGNNPEAPEEKTKSEKPALESELDKIAGNIISEEPTEEPAEAKLETPEEKPSASEPEPSTVSEKDSEEKTAPAPEPADQMDSVTPESDEPVISVTRNSSYNQVRGIGAIEKVLQEYMGFLGMALLEREKQHFEIPEIRNVRVSQLKSINERLFHSTSLVVGIKTAEKIMMEIDDYIGGQ